ncbi:MAG: hypothetical protein AB4050_00310 [Synechococcus sp.]
MHNLSDSDSDRESDLQQEILRGRKFTLSEAIAREAGSFMKGESPIPKYVQAEYAAKTIITKHLTDSGGILQIVLGRWVTVESRISRYVDDPVMAVHETVKMLLEQNELFSEFVREVDIQWGQVNGERPHFQRLGEKAHPEDEYSHESVREQLSTFLQSLTIS